MSGRRLAVAALAMGFSACSGGAGAQPAGSLESFPADAPRIVARDTAFVGATVAVPANTSFALVFDNRDGDPHNVTILSSGSGGAPRFTGEIFSGPGSRLYTVPALERGSYRFRCDVHPSMTGSVTAG
jgi:plastocyanin